MLAIKLGNLLKIELGGDEDNQITSPALLNLSLSKTASLTASPMLLELNEAIGDLLGKIIDETTGDSIPK